MAVEQTTRTDTAALTELLASIPHAHIHDAAQAELAALVERNQRLATALGDLINDVQLWCEAVSRDSSWDSWDHHYKWLHYGNLDQYLAVLRGAP